MRSKILERCAGLVGGLALGTSVALGYEGGHTAFTCAAWAVGGILLLSLAMPLWASRSYRKDKELKERDLLAGTAQGVDGNRERVGIENSGDMDLEDVSLGPGLDTGIRNQPGGRLRGRTVVAE